MDSIQSNKSKDSGYGQDRTLDMAKRESQLSDLTEYLDKNSAKKIISDPMNQSQLSEAIYELIPNAAYVSERSADELGGTNVSSPPILKMEIPSQPVEKESRRSNEKSGEERRKSASSHTSDSVFPRTGKIKTCLFRSVCIPSFGKTWTQLELSQSTSLFLPSLKL